MSKGIFKPSKFWIGPGFPKMLDEAITAVHYAAYLGKVEIFKYLSKERGAKGPYFKLLTLAKKQAS